MNIAFTLFTFKLPTLFSELIVTAIQAIQFIVNFHLRY